MIDFFRDFDNLSPEILESKVKIIDKLSSKAGTGVKAGDTRVFYQNWQPFAYACILGIIANTKIPVEAKKNDKINRDKFKYLTIKRNGPIILDGIILAMVSLNDKGCKLFTDPLEMNKDISAYANYGFELLEEQLNTGELMYITSFISQIKERQSIVYM